MDNIRFGRVGATDEECINAAKLANADGFIQMLPKGYQTVLDGDGSGLSQGQRQLISIARAAVADPPVMIDTANAYMNEKAVGRGIKASGLKRDEIYLSTKLWPSVYATADEAINDSLISLWQHLDKPISICKFCCIDTFFISCTFSTKPDIVHD